LHEASIIATKERADMKMIEFFIARTIVVTALDIQSQSAVRRKACKVIVIISGLALAAFD